MFQSAPEFVLRRLRHYNKDCGAESAYPPDASKTGLQPSYKAAVCTELGQPLQLLPVEIQPLQSDQVRVSLKYAGINFFDILLCQGKYQEKRNVPFIPGAEASGEVIEIGSEVSNCSVGDRVAVSVQGTGRVSAMSGAYGEQVVVSSKGVLVYPEWMALEDIAAFQGSYITAYLTLKHQANLQPGETVLITACAGGAGLACLDLAINVFGAKVIGVAGGDTKCALVKAKGAMAAIDYGTEPDFKFKVMQMTDRRGADVIVDMVGGKTTEECVRCLALGGRLMIVGFASGHLPLIPANQLLVKRASAIGVWWGGEVNIQSQLTERLLSEVNQFLVDKKVKPHIGQIFPLTKVNEAFEYILNRQSMGKVLLDLSC